MASAKAEQRGKPPERMLTGERSEPSSNESLKHINYLVCHVWKKRKTRSSDGGGDAYLSRAKDGEEVRERGGRNERRKGGPAFESTSVLPFPSSHAVES